MANLVAATEIEETGKWKERRKVYVDSSVSPQRVLDAVIIESLSGGPKIDLADYKIYKKDDDASPHYFGSEREDGAWYIMRETLAVGDDTYEWAKGDSDIATNWGNRVGLSYDTYSNTF